MNKELPAGSTLLHYHIVSKIGAGGMGEVYLAEDSKQFNPNYPLLEEPYQRKFEVGCGLAALSNWRNQRRVSTVNNIQTSVPPKHETLPPM